MDRNLLVTAVDLTRACSAHEQYLEWLALYEPVLHGSLGIANYFGLAAEAYERATQLRRDFDNWEASELLADLLMASVPMTPEDLAAAAAQDVEECGLPVEMSVSQGNRP